jgi:hypothetical protein
VVVDRDVLLLGSPGELDSESDGHCGCFRRDVGRAYYSWALVRPACVS